MISVEPGLVIDRYSVEEKLGEGGMATVYLVRHTGLGTLHALKVLTVNSVGIRQRLIQEGRIQGTLQHPNIVAVTDMVDLDGSPGLVMQFISGPALDDFLKTERLSLHQADVIGRGIIRGVAAAHEHGLVHRDLKPGNVMLQIVGDRLIPKVADFGLAKVLTISGGQGRTRTGMAMGTPAYMAPEQIKDAAHVDHRADVWSLGAILYELVSGERAFGTGEMFDIFLRIRTGDLIPIQERLPGLPAHMVRAISGALTADLDARISTCEELLAIWTQGDAPPSGVWDAQTVERATALGRRAETPSLTDEAETLTVGLHGQPKTELNETIGLFEPIAGSSDRTQEDAETLPPTEPLPPITPSPMRPSLRLGVAGLIAILAVGAVAAVAWVASMPRGTVVQDFRDARFERDGWVGVGLLGEDHVLEDYVEVTTTAGRVESVRYIVFPIDDTDYQEIRQTWAGGDLKRIEYMTGYGHPWRVQEVSREGDALILRNRDREGGPVLGPNYSAIEVRHGFDDAGGVARLAFGGLTGNAMPDPDGVWTIRLERDALGREIRRTFQGPDGERSATNDGLVEQVWEYKDTANPFKYSATVHLGWSGAPLVGDDGCHRDERLHDETGRLSHTRCLDPRKKPVADRYSGCIETSFEYGLEEVVVACTDDGKPVASRSGWATLSRSVGSDGTYFLNRYRDLNGDLVADEEGIAGRGYTIDPRGTLVGAGPYTDIDGEIVFDHRGVYGSRLVIDPYGYKIDLVNLDQRGNPMAELEGVVSTRYTHDAAGNVTSYGTFGAEGQPVLTKDGIHGIRNVYGPFGHNRLTECVGLDGQLIANKLGWATLKLQIDERIGKYTSRSVFDANGRRALVKSLGFSREQRNYDDFGRLVEIATFDTQDQPISAADGHERIRYEYNPRGQRIGVHYMYSDGSPLKEKGELSRVEMAYDAYGNQTSYRGFDGTGAPTVAALGCARLEFDFDLDLEVERRCFSPSGRKIEAKRTEYDPFGRVVAHHFDLRRGKEPGSVRYKWDKRGNKTSEAHFDGDGNPLDTEDGWSRWERRYDGRNREELVQYFDATGAKTNHEACDCHSKESIYDPRGRRAEARYTMADGGERDGGVLVKMRYDQRNSLVEQALFDAAGEPWARGDGATRVVVVRDSNGEQTRQIRYDVHDNEL